MERPAIYQEPAPPLTRAEAEAIARQIAHDAIRNKARVRFLVDPQGKLQPGDDSKVAEIAAFKALA